MSEQETPLTEAPSAEPVETPEAGAVTEPGLEASPPSSESEAAAEPTTEGSSEPEPTKTAAEIRAEIEAEIRAEEQAKADKRLAGLQSAKDREIQQLRQQQSQAIQSKLAEADRLNQTNPQQANPVYREVAHMTAEQQRQEQLYSQWQGWTADQMEAIGKDLSDPAVQEELVTTTNELLQADMQGQRTPAMLQVQSRLFMEKAAADQGTIKQERKEKEELQKVVDGFPEQMDQMLTRKLTKAGIVPEQEPGAPPSTEPEQLDFSKMSRAERKRHVAQLRRQELRALRET